MSSPEDVAVAVLALVDSARVTPTLLHDVVRLAPLAVEAPLSVEEAADIVVQARR